MYSSSAAAQAQREASGRAVADLLCRLVTSLCPDSPEDVQDSLISYSTMILGSLVGSGGTRGNGQHALWAVGDKVERRLAATAADDATLLRFKVLRAELSTSKHVIHKA